MILENGFYRGLKILNKRYPLNGMYKITQTVTILEIIKEILETGAKINSYTLRAQQSYQLCLWIHYVQKKSQWGNDWWGTFFSDKTEKYHMWNYKWSAKIIIWKIILYWYIKGTGWSFKN